MVAGPDTDGLKAKRPPSSTEGSPLVAAPNPSKPATKSQQDVAISTLVLFLKNTYTRSPRFVRTCLLRRRVHLALMSPLVPVVEGTCRGRARGRACQLQR